jgi:hypothetical protein
MDTGFHPLEGRFARMKPLKSEHKDEVLAAIDCDPASWSILPQPNGEGLPAVRHAIVDLILLPPSQRCPYCRRRIREKPQRINLPKKC